MKRMNILVSGKRGYGKSTLIKSLISNIFPDKKDTYILSVDDSFQYSGQNIIYFNRCNPKQILNILKNEDNLYRVFKPYPDENDNRIGTTIINNQINIVETVEEKYEFIDEFHSIIDLDIESDPYKIFYIMINILDNLLMIRVSPVFNKEKDDLSLPAPIMYDIDFNIKSILSSPKNLQRILSPLIKITKDYLEIK